MLKAVRGHFALNASRHTLLCLTTALCSGLAFPALAQSSAGTPVAPVQSSPDNYGVDLATGALNLSITDISVGNEASGLTHKRHWVGLNQWRDQFDLTLVESNGKVTVSVGGGSGTFTKSGASYITDQGDGASLVLQDYTYTYTTKDGTVTTFDHFDYRDGYRATQVRRPDGDTLTFNYTDGYYWILNHTETQDMSRLDSVQSSSGYKMTFRYASNTASDAASAKVWLTRTGVSIENSSRGTGLLATSTYNQSSYTGARTLTVSDMAGRATAYAIDSSGRITSVTYPGSASADVSIVYNTIGRISSVTDLSGTTSYSYTDSGNVRTTKVTDPNGSISNYSFNIVTQKMLSSTNALGQVTYFQYDGYGRVTRVTAPEGSAVQNTYDTRGNIIETRAIAKAGSGIADAISSSSFPCFSAATCDKPQWTRDARGSQTDFSYDSVTGGVLSVVAPQDAAGLRATTTFGYATVNGVQRPVRSAICRTGTSCPGTANERVTTISYDVNGLPTTVTDQAGDGSLASSTSTIYDVFGNAVSIDGPLPGADDTNYFRYDAARQLLGRISPDPDGTGPLTRRATRITFDTRGRPVRTEQGNVADPSDSGWNGFTSMQQVDRRFDGLDRQISEITSAAGTVYSVTQNSYTGQRLDCSAVRLNNTSWGTLPSSACSAQADGVSGPDRITKYGYDSIGRVTQTTAGYGTAAAATEATTYTANGKTSSITDANGNVTSYAYDGMDQLQTTTYPGGSYDQAQYDAGGKLLSRRLRDGQTISYQYDALGRVTLKTPAGENPVGYAYDLFGNLMSTSRADVGTNTIGYDALGRQTSDSQTFGSTNYQYDSAGRQTRVSWGDGFFVTYDYNLTGAVTGIRENGGLLLVSFAYDNLGRRTTVGRANGTTSSYSYNAGSQLTSLTHDLAGGAWDIGLTFGYNTASQIISRTASNTDYAYTGSYTIDRAYTVNSLNQYANSGGVVLGYDARGNMTGSGSLGYGYTVENRLKTASGGISLLYDQLGRLQEYDTDVSTRFIYEGNQISAEIANPGGALMRRYIYGPGDDEPILWYEGAGTGDRRWLIPDERGSIIAVTDGAGNAAAINRYDEFGIPASTNMGRFQYTGQAWLPSLGMYHYKARVYSPTLGRFLQTDPIGYNDGTNWYAYVGNDPINKTDPSGLIAGADDIVVMGTLKFALPVAAKIAVAAFGGIGSVISGIFGGGGPSAQQIRAKQQQQVRNEQNNRQVGHRYETLNKVCKLALSVQQRASLLRLAAVPGHEGELMSNGTYPAAPYGVYGGYVNTRFSADYNQVVNITTWAHAFSGSITRTIFSNSSGTYIRTIGIGNAGSGIIGRARDWINAKTGPQIFNDVDNAAGGIAKSSINSGC